LAGKKPKSYFFWTHITSLHEQNKSVFFGGPASFLPIRAFRKLSDCSDWLDKSRPSKNATFALIM